MSTSAEVALSIPDILDNILEHVYTFVVVDQVNYAPLLSACLVARAWFQPAQELLNRQLHFRHDLWRVKQWIDFVNDQDGGGRNRGSNGKAKFVSIGVSVQCAETLDEQSRSYECIGEMLGMVKGLVCLVLNLAGQKAIPSEWVSVHSSTLRQLILGSPLTASDKSVSFKAFELLSLRNQSNDLTRDWSDTFKNLTRWNAPLSQVELLGVTNYTRYLVPKLPLRKDPRLLRGTLLPFADNLRSLNLPYLVPSTDIYNLPILGVACRSLENLEFAELSSHSASSIPLLRFFPTLKALRIKLLVGLPYGPFLHPEQVAQMSQAGRGDVVAALLKLWTEDPPELRLLSITKAKFFYAVQRPSFFLGIHKKGGGMVFLPEEAQLTPEEQAEVHYLELESTNLKELDEAERIYLESRAQAEKALEDLQVGGVNGTMELVENVSLEAKTEE